LLPKLCYDGSVFATLRFLGAAGTVTGSRFLLRHGSARTLVDCGLFQGPRSLRQRNWQPFPVNVQDLDRIVLTHAHIDHTGFLPRLVRQGFRRPVLASHATCDLLQLLLPDAGRLQEEEARWRDRKGLSRHKPALPLFSEDDARAALDLLRPVPYDQIIDLGEEVGLRLLRAGHILGSALVEFRWPEPGPQSTLLFSGDLGRPGQPILKDPAPVRAAGVLVLESTWGDRTHPRDDPLQDLERIIRRALDRRGVVLIPSFAIGRTHRLLYLLHELQEAGRIPPLPVFIDSPMAISAVPLYCRHVEEHDLTMRALTAEECPLLLPNLRMMRTVEQSKSLNDLNGSAIIISASGMATGGRIVHHLRRRLADSRNTVIFVGYQAQGTRGRYLQEGARTIRIYGDEIPVRARIETLTGLSAHADAEEILGWLEKFDYAPSMTYLVHGEPESCHALAGLIRQRLRWETTVAEESLEVRIRP
jgi:metallo-beta-lactamase family protein